MYIFLLSSISSGRGERLKRREALTTVPFFCVQISLSFLPVRPRRITGEVIVPEWPSPTIPPFFSSSSECPLRRFFFFLFRGRRNAGYRKPYNTGQPTKLRAGSPSFLPLLSRVFVCLLSFLFLLRSWVGGNNGGGKGGE